MAVNQKTLDLIAKYEGCVLVAYKDTGGVWTIGVGHTSDSYFKVIPGAKITQQQAYDLLQHDIVEAEAGVNSSVKVPLNENQYGALVSFTFNLGVGALRGSTLLRKLNSRDYKSVPSELNKWVHDNGVVLKGLVARRAAEGELWNTPVPDAPASNPVQTAPQEQAANTGTSFWQLLFRLLGFK